MTDPTQQRPVGFKLINRTDVPLRTCGRPDGHSLGCVSTTFPVHGIECSHVCGKIVGYQIGTPDAFHFQSEGIDSYYVCGYSLTHGQPKEHIWTFAGTAAEEFDIDSHVCPCTKDNCTILHWRRLRQGCGSTSTCCEFNNPAWFFKHLPQPTTGDIEMRLCENSPPSPDDSPFELLELYLQ